MLLFIIATVKLIWFKALRPFYFKFIKGKLCTKSARKEDYLQHTDLSSKEENAFQKEKDDIFGIQDNRVSSKLEDQADDLLEKYHIEEEPQKPLQLHKGRGDLDIETFFQKPSSLKEEFNFAERAKANQQSIFNENGTDVFTPAFNFAENYKQKLVSYDKDVVKEAHNQEMQMQQTIDEVLPHQIQGTPSTQVMNLFELYGELPHKNPNFEAQENLRSTYKPNGIYGSQLDQFKT